MLVFKKEGGEKLVDPNSKLIPILKADGWKEEGEADEPVLDLDALKAEADEMELEYHPNIGAKKLAAKIEEAKSNDTDGS